MQVSGRRSREPLPFQVSSCGEGLPSGICGCGEGKVAINKLFSWWKNKYSVAALFALSEQLNLTGSQGAGSLGHIVRKAWPLLGKSEENEEERERKSIQCS